jgi:hypothetical protein
MKREHRRKSEGRRESAFSFVLKREPLVKQIYALSRELGVRVYLVGGVMRNLALDLPLPSDYDLAVEGDVKGFVDFLYSMKSQKPGGSLKRGLIQSIVRPLKALTYLPTWP